MKSALVVTWTDDPTAMIFTPCRDGISQHEAEHAELGYTAPGVDVLLHAALACANR